MRRASDRENGERTGRGRRARDRMLEGQPTISPVIQGRYELQNLVLFLGDDLRESALALGGIEGFLFEAQRLLEKPELTPEELRRMVDDTGVLGRLDLLADALASLRRSLGRIQGALNDPPMAKPDSV